MFDDEDGSRCQYVNAPGPNPVDPPATLILLSGYPSSGKTFRARQLTEYLRVKVETTTSAEGSVSRPQLSVHGVDDQSLGIARVVYGDGNAREEKEARAKIMSAIKRLVGRNNIVIADGLNYIKGYRYQIYCEAKAAKTPSCVVHIGTPIDVCREQNSRLLADGNGGYSPEIFESLVMRYEEPNGLTRWDSPLFTVLHSDVTPPNDAIWDSLMGDEGQGVIVRPNLATVAPVTSTASYLADLSKLTQQVVDQITQQQIDNGAGCQIQFNDPRRSKLQLPTSTINVGQLQRLRRQFIIMSRSHTLAIDRMETAFLEYLVKALGGEQT